MGDGSVAKALPTQAGGPEFRAPNLQTWGPDGNPNAQKVETRDPKSKLAS